MLDIDKFNNITITKGDSAYFSIELRLKDGAPYKKVVGDLLVFTAKKSASDNNPIVIEADDKGYIVFYPETTAERDAGVYEYDVQLTTEGQVYTTNKGWLRIREEFSI